MILLGTDTYVCVCGAEIIKISVSLFLTKD